VVICLERGADLHMAQLMPLPLTVSCFSKIQIGFTFLVLAHPGSPGQRAVKRVCVYFNIEGSQFCDLRTRTLVAKSHPADMFFFRYSNTHVVVGCLNCER